MSVDFLNPNHWPIVSPHEHRIYGDDNAQTWGVVDEEDYHFLIQWKWSWTTPHTAGMKDKKRPTEKRYLRRVVETQIPSPYKGSSTYINPEHGNEVRFHKPRVQQTLKMHTVIMLRSGITPPSPDHIIPDHLDGDEKNYRRNNLRWATHGMNALNLHGRALREMNDGQ